MRKLNKILLVFFAFSFLTIYGGWRFIHSRKFSEEASKKVSEILTRKMGAKLSFTGVDFRILPPSTTFNNVHIEKNDPRNINVDLQVERFKVSFTYASFFASELEINDLTLENGMLKIKTGDEKSSDINWKELNTKKLFNLYQDYLLKSPVQLNLARIENTRLDIDGTQLTINSLGIAPHKRSFKLRAQVSDVFVNYQMKDYPPFEINKGTLQFELNKNELKIDRLQAEKGQFKLDLKSNIFNEKNILSSATNANIGLDLDELLKTVPHLPAELKGMKGAVNGVLALNGPLFDPDVELSIASTGFKSQWINLQSIKAFIKKKKNILSIDKFHAQNGKENYELLRPLSFLDLKRMAFLRLRAPLLVKEANTNTFLFAINDTLESLKGSVSGKVDVVWDGSKVNFEIKEPAVVKNFKLQLPGNKIPVLQNNGFTLEDTVFSLDKNFKLSLVAKARMSNSILKASGDITDKDIHVSIKDSTIDMKSFGPISGIAIEGSGPASAEIYGPFEDVKFDFLVDWNNFSLIDLHFGKVKSSFSLYLKDLRLDIHQLEGAFNQTLFNAGGSLSFGDKPDMDLHLDFKNSSFSDAQKMYNLVFKNIKLPVTPEFNFNASYRIRGGYSLDALNIDGAVAGTDLKVAGEVADKLAFNFLLKNGILNFNNVKIQKGRGGVNANVSINLANNYTELEGGASGLHLHDFNFYRLLNLEYDGDLIVDFDGNGTVENFSSRFKTRLINPFIANIPASPSSAIFYLNSDDVAINASLLAGKIKLDSLINFKSRLVSLKSSIDTSDVREVLGAVAGHNMSEKNISGRIKGNLNAQIGLDNFNIKRLFLNFNQFNIKKGDINVNVDPKFNTVALEEGIVKNWNLRFSDGNDFFESKAKNISSDAIVFDQNFSIKTSVLEFFIGSIDKTIGVITGSNQIVLDKKINITRFSLAGLKNSIKFKNMPGAITDLEYKIEKKGNRFEITNFKGKYGEGDIQASGFLIFDDLYPETIIDYKIERSTIPLFKRSNVVVSSTGSITGTDLPYKLNGKVSLLHGEFLDDPSDFNIENKVSLDNLKKYLPQKSEADKKGILSLNIGFNTLNQIVVKNNLAEVYLKGSGQVEGDVMAPEITATIEAQPAVSKFKFKGHDFLLKEGSVEIRDRGKNRNSDLKFISLARINDYDVTLGISGSIAKPVITLSSEPSLAQEDLLSLLTLGVTSDISKNLEARDRSSVMTMSLGTLLVDQLKINEDLNSTLGINVNVTPEFKEDETSLIQGKSAVSDTGGSKLKSATKIKINKKINKAVDVSVSTTVGGSIEQTQEMNINYNINKKFSIQGVYEVKPSEEENTDTPNSIGADLKYRWSF